MPEPKLLVFAPFRVNLGSERVWRGDAVLSLTNKAFAVLRYFVEHAEQLITREALLEAVWPGTHVGDEALTVCIHELRKVLGDSAQTPQFIFDSCVLPFLVSM